jgi:hypothetical protein
MNAALATLFAASFLNATTHVTTEVIEQDGQIIEITRTTLVVSDKDAAAGDEKPMRMTAEGPDRDAALSAAFELAEAECGSRVRNLGFDTHDRAGGAWAEMWFRCTDKPLAD